MDMMLLSANELSVDGKTYACASGKGGIKLDKREGDGATPVGEHPVRLLFYRPDIFAVPPITADVPTQATHVDWGWCDAPDHPLYNQLVKLPFDDSHEKMWREDDVYDLVLVLGYNDHPVRPGRGSAIFMHLARPGYVGTEGCVALNRPDFLEILAKITPDSRLIVPAHLAA